MGHVLGVFWSWDFRWAPSMGPYFLKRALNYGLLFGKCLWYHTPSRAIVADTSRIPQNDSHIVACYFGLLGFPDRALGLLSSLIHGHGLCLGACLTPSGLGYKKWGQMNVPRPDAGALNKAT